MCRWRWTRKSRRPAGANRWCQFACRRHPCRNNADAPARSSPLRSFETILDARARGQYRGLGYFHFYWQRAENTASLGYLRSPGEPRGVLVINVPGAPGWRERRCSRPDDIILQIDGFDVDMQGDYNDPDFGQLLLENLSTRGKWAGDDVKMKIWRDGQPMDVTYRLPKYEYCASLVPSEFTISRRIISSWADWCFSR